MILPTGMDAHKGAHSYVSFSKDHCEEAIQSVPFQAKHTIFVLFQDCERRAVTAPGLGHYGVRLYGTVRKYGVQPYLYGFRLYLR